MGNTERDRVRRRNKGGLYTSNSKEDEEVCRLSENIPMELG
jgi:hypothetical protein